MRSVVCMWYRIDMALVDTDFTNNVQRIRPFLGVALVACFTLAMFVIMKNALDDITQVVHTEAPMDVHGTLKLTTRSPIEYKSSVAFRATVSGAGPETSSYISTVCFQEETLVYQRSAQPGVDFYLTDQYERDLEWDGGFASCSATLMYRVPSGAVVNLYILDSVSFDVAGE